MKNLFTIILTFLIGSLVGYLSASSQPRPVGKTIKLLDSEIRLPSRDIVTQYQKLYAALENFETWDDETKKTYFSQHSIDDKFISSTKEYFKSTAKPTK